MSADTITPTTSIDASPARALGAFLRRMRDRAAPDAARSQPRRRAVGLRREEVATAAGISITWYTWLEQGRAVRVSRGALGAIADALHLDSVEREHMLRLAGVAYSTDTMPISRFASDSLCRFVDALAPHAAYAINGTWDVIYENAAAKALLGEFRAGWGTDNVLARLFLDAKWRELFQPWEPVARSAVAQFRAATTAFSAEPEWRAFVARLIDDSDEFAMMWARHDLAEPTSREKTLNHPTRGTLQMLYASLVPDAEPADVRVVLYTPAPPTSE